MNEALVRVRDRAINRLAPLGDHPAVGRGIEVGIRAENFWRWYLGLAPRAVRKTWGLASATEVRRLRERVAALEDQVRELRSSTR